MDSPSYSHLGKAITTFFLILLAALPFAIWKIIEIILWVFTIIFIPKS